MKAAEFEQYLTTFLDHCRQARYYFEEAQAEEQYPNDATQDLLHIAEFAPSQLEGVDIISILHGLRETRREAKKELEVAQYFHTWAEENKLAISKLEQALGNMRKVLRRQPHDMYRCRTSIIGEKDNWLQADPEPYHQLTMYELLVEGNPSK